MERCPVCDAPTRPGAKFCTACGARLPDAAAPPDQPGPPAATAESAAPAWPAPPDDAPTAPEPAPAVDEPGAAASWPQPGGWDAGWSAAAEPAPADGHEPASAWEPPRFDAAPSAPETAADAEPADAILPPPVELAPFAAPDDEPATPAEAEPYVAPAMAEPEIAPEPVDTIAAVADAGAAERAPAVDEAASLEPAETEPGRRGGAFTDTPEAIAWTAGAGVAATAAPVAGVGDPRERAVALVDELRDLLPRLGSGPALDPAALADRLEAGLAADHARWEALRATLEDARGRPRDVDTILQLSQRVDDVLALIDGHERLTEAVRGAVETLRAAAPGSTGGETR